MDHRHPAEALVGLWVDCPAVGLLVMATVWNARPASGQQRGIRWTDWLAYAVLARSLDESRAWKDVQPLQTAACVAQSEFRAIRAQISRHLRKHATEFFINHSPQ